MIDLAAKPFYLKPEDIEWVNTTLAGMTTEEKGWPAVLCAVQGM